MRICTQRKAEYELLNRTNHTFPASQPDGNFVADRRWMVSAQGYPENRYVVCWKQFDTDVTPYGSIGQTNGSKDMVQTHPNIMEVWTLIHLLIQSSSGI